jgi:hypothetical protein
VFRNDAVPVFGCSVFRCSVVPVFLVLLIAKIILLLFKSIAKSRQSTVVTLIFWLSCFQQQTKMGHLTFSTNINSRFDFYFSGKYLLLWDWFLRGFLFVISSYRPERHVLRNNYCSNTFTPPVFFSRNFNKLRIFSVPVFRVPEWCCSGVPCSGVPGFTNSRL